MSFGKKEKPAKKTGWVCGCGRTQPHYVLYCPRCKKGQK